MYMNSSLTKLNKDSALVKLLEPFRKYLDDPEVNEILINKPEEIWLKKFNSFDCIKADFATMDYMSSLMTAVYTYNAISPSGISYFILPGGERGTAAIPPAVVNGFFSFIIRKHSLVVKDIESLATEGAFDGWRNVSFNKPNEKEIRRLGSLNDFNRLDEKESDLLSTLNNGEIVEFLKKCVVYKKNIIISGKTGSGKTTFCRSLIEEVPRDERIITIEDVHELVLDNHPNKVHMLYGNANGRVSADECLMSCMRQSPDRIFLAEIRGNEAWEYMNSLNTGHPGAISTTHANSAIQTFERIATLIKKSEVGRLLDISLIRQVLYGTIDVVLYFNNRQLIEVFYDPIFSNQQKIA